MQVANSVGPADHKILTFRLSGQMFAIPMSALIELREWEAPTPVPGSPPFMKGVINLRGAVMPVIDLSDRLGNGATDLHPRSCVMIAETGGSRAGFLVDGVEDIVNVADRSLQPPPAVQMTEPGMVSAVVEIGKGSKVHEDGKRSETALVLDLDALGIHQISGDAAAE